MSDTFSHKKDDGLLIKPSRYRGSFAAWFGGFAHGQKNTEKTEIK